MNKVCKKLFLFCLLFIFVLTGLTACGGDEGVKVNSANALARKLASDSAVKINVSKDIVLDEPIVVSGEKEIVGSGKIIAAVEDGEELYMITVADGGKLTVGGSVKIDAAGLMGVIHVQDGGSAIVQDKAVVKNASKGTANALVEGSLEVKGGTLKGAKGHNIYNKKETVISGGEVTGSGTEFAGIFNEGTLTQKGGTVSKAYNNISNVKGSTFTFEGGTNTESTRDGVFVAEGATMKATNKDATIVNAGARGILLHGQADIKVITVKECGDTLIKVGQSGVLNLMNGILQEGNYHGVDNAGTMTMNGGTIQMNSNCGIVNTGTLKVISGSIANNANKGILNKHEGTADVTSAMVTFSANKTAIANEDKAVFEFAKAKIMMSTQTNIYCYDGTINIHDASLNASASNNVRIIEGTINMNNVEVKGNSQSSGTSHHGIYMEGGVINAENVTVSMTTGNGIRNKGGVFNGKNIVMHDINRVGISQGKHDYLDVEGLTEIEGLEIQSTNYANIWNEGGGTIKIKNGKLAVASSNSVRSNDGRTELTNVTIPGHKEGSKDNIHGVYLEGGEIIAKNVTIQNTSGNALRNKSGKFVGNNIKMTNIKGQSAIWNLPLDDEHKNGIIDIDGLTIRNSASKNITLDSGVTTIKNATLGTTGGNNIKMQNNAATLNLHNVKIEGQRKDATANTHGIMVEGGNVFGENVQIMNTNACGIRCKMGVVNLKNVTMTELGQAGISNGKMVKDDVEVGVGNVTIDGLTITKAGTNNVVLDAGTVNIKNGVLGKVETNNHNTKVAGTGVLTMDTVKVEGTSNGSKYGIIAEGGDAVLKDVEIYDLKKSGIHANKETSNVKGTNVTVRDAVYAITGSNGVITINGFETEDISANNILADGKLKVTIKNGMLCETPGHNAKATGDALVTLDTVEILGVTDGSKHAIMAEAGDFVLKDVVIKDVKNTGIRINKETSSVKGENVTIQNAANAVTGSAGVVEIAGLTTTDVTGNNVVADGDTEKGIACEITITDAELCKTAGHNVKAANDGMVILDNVEIKGVSAGDKYGIIAEKGGDAKLTDVTITDVKKTNAIHVNNAESKITGENVTITNSNNGVFSSNGEVVIDNLVTSGITNNNVLVNNKGHVTINNSEVNAAGGHNMKAEADGLITLNNVKVLGVTSGSKHVLMAEGGDFELSDVEITGAKNAAIRINRDTSSVTGEDVTITDSANGITGTKGEVVIDALTTSNVEGNNLLAESDCIMVITGGDLGQSGGHNVKATGSAVITLENMKVKGTDSTSHHAIMAEGGDIALDNVEISGVTAKADGAAIRINTSSSEITGKDVTITDCNYGISGNAGSVSINKLTSSAVKRNLNIEGGTFEIKNATLNVTTQNNVHMTAGTLTLNGASIAGTTGETVQVEQEDGSMKEVTYGCGISVEKATLNLENGVTIKETYLQGIYNNGGTINAENTVTIINTRLQGILNSGGTLKGAKAVVQDTQNIALGNTSAGKVELDELVVSGVKSGHSIKNEGANSTIIVEKGDIGTAPTNNIYVSNGKVTLKNTTIKGTTSNHGILATGGDVELENVVIENAKLAGIRVNKGSSEVKGTNVTIKGCAEGISNSDGVVEMENLDTTGVTGHGIWTNATLKIAGVVKSKIHMDVANAVTATKALTGSAITLDWTASKIPQDLVGIQFANAADATASKGTVVLGSNASETYAPYFSGAQMLLTDKSNMLRTVTNYDELLDALTYMKENDVTSAIITIAGDIVVENEIAIEAGKEVRLVDDGTVRTISRAASYTKGDLFNVASGAKLTLASTSNNNKTIMLKVDGGSANETPVITGTDSSFVRNNGTLTVESGVQFANAKGSTSYCKALAIFAAEGSTTTFKGVMQSIVGQHNGGYGIAVTIGNTEDFIIENAIIQDNYTPGTGIIRLESGGKLTIKNSTFKNNESVTEAGVISDSGNGNNRLTIEGSTFEGNKTSGNGGALSVRCATKDNIKITDTSFTGNTASAGAAINTYGGTSLTLEDCEFSNNATTNTATVESGCGYGDIRMGDNRTGGIYISGKMIVDIYMNQAGVVNVVGALTEDSDVVANWRLGKITGDSFDGIIYKDKDVMNASKDYISLSNNYKNVYVIKNAGTTGTLVKPIGVTNEAELKAAITTISGATDKTGYIQVTGDFTISAAVSVPQGLDVTILDNGAKRTISRDASYTKGNLFEVASGASLTFRATGDNSAPTLSLEGGSANKTPVITGTDSSLIRNAGTVMIESGVQLANAKGSTSYCKALAIFAEAGSTTTFKGVMKSIVGQYNGGYGIAVTIGKVQNFVIEDALVQDNYMLGSGIIRLEGGGKLEIKSSVFKNNESVAGGGVLTESGNANNRCTIVGSTFTENKTSGSGGALHFQCQTRDNVTIKNTTFNKNTAKEGAAINTTGGTSLTLENCEFTNNETTGTNASHTKCGFGDIRMGDNRTGGIYISGKMVVDIYMNQAGVVNVVGELAEGSKVIANWRMDKVTSNSFTGINFASEEMMEASKGYLELSANQKDKYELTFSGTNGILKKK